MIIIIHLQYTESLNMTSDKRKALKSTIKLQVLAHMAGISINYLSLIINNHRPCTDDLAERLAYCANRLLLDQPIFKPTDFQTK